MKFFNLRLIPCNSAGELHRKFKRRIKKRRISPTLQGGVKMAFIIAVSGFILLDYFRPFAETRPRSDIVDKSRDFHSSTKPSRHSDIQEVLNLAQMIRLITDDQLLENKVLRYAGLIWHASQKYGVNPREIIALIMAESNFRESSINSKTGDYGLGQINWQHWGKPYGLTTQDLLNPSINIYLTCHVYKFFDKDFGKYHRGNGIKCKAYLVNVRSILSTLDAFSELNQKNIS